MIDRFCQNVGFQHHAGAAAGRRIVDRAMPVFGEIPDLQRIDRPVAALQRPCRKASAPRCPGNISG